MALACSKNLSISVTALEPIAWWKMDEVGPGNRVDSIGGVIISEAGDPVGSGAGKISLAAAVVGSPFADLETIDASLVYQGNGFDMCGWVKFNTLGVGHTVQIGYYNYADAVKGVDILFHQTARPTDFTVLVRGNSGAPSEAIDVPLALVAGTWVFWRVFYDPVAQRFGAQVNDGPIVQSSVKPFSAQADVVFFVAWLGSVDALVDEVGIFDSKLTDAEASSLYNGGAGVTFP